jgi:hypothetical protein
MKRHMVILPLLALGLAVFQGGCRSGTWFPKNRPAQRETLCEAQKRLSEAPGHPYDADRQSVRKDKR